MQTEHFRVEIEALMKSKNVCNETRLPTLGPFTDNNGVLRVVVDYHFSAQVYNSSTWKTFHYPIAHTT